MWLPNVSPFRKNIWAQHPSLQNYCAAMLSNHLSSFTLLAPWANMSGLSCNYTSSFILARWSNYTLMSIKQYMRKAGMTGLGNMPLYIKCLDQASLSKITNHNMISLILSRKKINDVLIWHKSQRILIFH